MEKKGIIGAIIWAIILILFISFVVFYVATKDKDVENNVTKVEESEEIPEEILNISSEETNMQQQEPSGLDIRLN